MKILFTGASSFSGMWILQELALAGHEVTAIFRQPLESYTGIRRQRIEQILPYCTSVFGTLFGSDDFIRLIHSQAQWDMLCHHAADVTDYKNPNFDVSAALANNTLKIKAVLEVLKNKGCNKILLTGSVFEQREGSGSDQLRAVSAYGLSKGLTADAFMFYASILQVKLAKFVIPNPFGQFEEGRFTTYLIKTWLEGKTAQVKTPLYVRDNIPVTLLAKAYVHFATQLDQSANFERINPSFYVETQGAFTQRFAEQMSNRCNTPCDFELTTQIDFNEPLVRINTDRININQLKWNECQFWDDLAEYYQSTYSCSLAT